MNIICDPDIAKHFREFYKAVQPGYHMNKKHWHTVFLDGSLPDDEIFAMILAEQTGCFAPGCKFNVESTGVLLLFRPMAENPSHPFCGW